jgi:hypothetical protein
MGDDSKRVSEPAAMNTTVVATISSMIIRFTARADNATTEMVNIFVIILG